MCVVFSGAGPGSAGLVVVALDVKLRFFSETKGHARGSPDSEGELPGPGPGRADPWLVSGGRPARWVMCDVFPGLPSGTDLRFSADSGLAFPNFSSPIKIPVTRPCATHSGAGL